LPPYPITAAHGFLETTTTPSRTSYAAICSSEDREVFALNIDAALEHDVIDGIVFPIEWFIETGCVYPTKGASMIRVNEGSIELLGAHDTRVRIFIRTDQTASWQLWRDFALTPPKKPAGTKTLLNAALGKPPENCRVASWAQVRVEGLGACEIRIIDLDISEETTKIARDRTDVVESVEADYFLSNKSPSSQRWQSA
jgi:hypothetical protein